MSAYVLVLEGDHSAHSHAADVEATVDGNTALKVTAAQLSTARCGACGASSILEARWGVLAGDPDLGQYHTGLGGT